MEPDSVILPMVFDTIIYPRNHAVFKNKLGYCVLNIFQLPFHNSDYYDSFILQNM